MALGHGWGWAWLPLSLVPRPHPPKEWPGIHCLRMRLISQNSENLGYCRIMSAYDCVTFAYESANVSVSRSCKCRQEAFKLAAMIFRKVAA